MHKTVQTPKGALGGSARSLIASAGLLLLGLLVAAIAHQREALWLGASVSVSSRWLPSSERGSRCAVQRF